MRELRIEDLLKDNCYHICTNGEESPILMRAAEDYRIALNYLAISAWKHNIMVLAYCIMSNHVHILVVCKDRKQAEKFIRHFKMVYSMYMRKKYGTPECLHRIEDSISLIDSLQYLRNCICYILRNALCAKVCMKVEDYPWSSYSCYFKKNIETTFPVSTLSSRDRKRILRTRADLPDCPLLIDENGKVVAHSFIRSDLVEKAFMNSGRFFLSCLGTCNDVKMEYEMALKPRFRVNDTELINLAESLASSRFKGKKLSELSIQSKCTMVKNLYFNNKTSIPQLSRVLGLTREIVTRILST